MIHHGSGHGVAIGNGGHEERTVSETNDTPAEEEPNDKDRLEFKTVRDEHKVFKDHSDKDQRKEFKSENADKPFKGEKPEKPEKEKNEKFEKNEKWEKDEKEGKNEKELKDEKELKNEAKELKNEAKELKDEKEGKLEFKDNKDEGKEFPEKGPQFEGPIPDQDAVVLPVSRSGLRQQAEALEEAARQLRHFIEQSERPDLRRGALSNEDDQGESPPDDDDEDEDEGDG